MPTFDKESRRLINAARILGSQGLSVFLEDHELLRLCGMIACDLEREDLAISILGQDMSSDYFSTPLEWFQQPLSTQTTLEEFFLLMKGELEDFATYFRALCELHKRRRKFKLILEHQPLPELSQIVPRCLLEYGQRPSESLASWLVWRKWLYDIDNRAAQETGYLFEPILAAAIGGVPCAAAKSPIKRAANPLKGRQVDCLDGRQAYEFKMRVTIAASGQGRFQEELDFARDCHQSGYTPILLVLDPTPSPRLESLSKAYSDYGGKAYVGNQAWEHIVARAGSVMSRFVEKYIHIPLREVDRGYSTLLPIQVTNENNSLTIRVGDQSFTLSRRKTSDLIETLSDGQARPI